MRNTPRPKRKPANRGPQEQTKTYLEPEEVELLEQTPANARDRLLIRVLFRSGCRISEALALEVKDVNFDGCTITIQHLKSRIKLSCPQCKAGLGKRDTFCPSCGSRVKEAIKQEAERRRMRTVPLDIETITMLRDYIERGGAVKEGDKELVFGISRHRAWQIIKGCAEKAALPKLLNPETGKVHNVSPHKLRDAFAVHAVKQDDSGDGLRLLQEHLGHVSFSTTAKYRKVSGKELKDWYGRLWEKRS